MIAVTALSTIAMILYPPLARALGLAPADAGLFLGGTIHDVAQVVGAGYALSKETGDTATIAKLLRVAMLLPVCLAVGLAVRAGQGRAARSAPVLPGFAVVFALLVAANSAGLVPAAVASAGGELSRACLVAAIAAIGMRTSLRSLAAMGWRPALLVAGESAFLALLVAVHAAR